MSDITAMFSLFHGPAELTRWVSGPTFLPRRREEREEELLGCLRALRAFVVGICERVVIDSENWFRGSPSGQANTLAATQRTQPRDYSRGCVRFID